MTAAEIVAQYYDGWQNRQGDLSVVPWGNPPPRA